MYEELPPPLYPHLPWTRSMMTTGAVLQAQGRKSRAPAWSGVPETPVFFCPLEVMGNIPLLW